MEGGGLVSAALVIVPRRSDEPRPSGLTCLACAEYFGMPGFRPKVTIKPQNGLRLPSGQIVLEDAVVVCAHCLQRGVDTVL